MQPYFTLLIGQDGRRKSPGLNENSMSVVAWNRWGNPQTQSRCGVIRKLHQKNKRYRCWGWISRSVIVKRTARGCTVKNTNCPVSLLLVCKINKRTRNTNTLTACEPIMLLAHELKAAHSVSVSKGQRTVQRLGRPVCRTDITTFKFWEPHPHAVLRACPGL
jgi:hypothetical protein